MGLCHHDKVCSPSSKVQKTSLPDRSYIWTILSILGDLGLSWKTTVNLLMLAFLPLVLAVGIGIGILALGLSAAYMLGRLVVWLYSYVSPPI